MSATALLSAKRRATRRRERGAALFVVSMALTVLASVGIYALAAASNEVRTSGYERQSSQSHYLATYGILGTAHEISSTKAQFYASLMLSNRDTCAALANVPPNLDASLLACRRFGASELGAPWAVNPPITPYAGTAPFQPNVAPGSLGQTPTVGDFFVELTEPTQAPPPARYGLNLNFCFLQLTVTANGITRPVFATTDLMQTYSSEGVEIQRARIAAGPVTVGCN